MIQNLSLYWNTIQKGTIVFLVFYQNVVHEMILTGGRAKACCPPKKKIKKRKKGGIRLRPKHVNLKHE